MQYEVGTEEGYIRSIRQRSEALVIALVGKQAADKWWISPNKAFDGKTPEKYWLIDPRCVYNYLMHHACVGGGS